MDDWLRDFPFFVILLGAVSIPVCSIAHIINTRWFEPSNVAKRDFWLDNLLWSMVLIIAGLFASHFTGGRP